VTRFGLVLMRLMAVLPLPWVRALGVLLGIMLYVLAASRRKVVWTNLQLCFPNLSRSQVRSLAFRSVVCFAKSWLDRGWLWHGTPQLTKGRLLLTGAVEELAGQAPTVLFAPHFVGMDAGWTALSQQVPRHFSTIYSNQANKIADGWILAGRSRYGRTSLYGRIYGVKPLIAGLKQGEPLYLLPDMNFDPKESVFVPFYGVQAATVPSLARFARLGRAKVVPVISRMTADGYEIQVLPAWKDYPSGDLVADTARMNRSLESYIDTMPEQYYWVHKRFKDRPEGETAPY